MAGRLSISTGHGFVGMIFNLTVFIFLMLVYLDKINLFVFPHVRLVLKIFSRVDILIICVVVPAVLVIIREFFQIHEELHRHGSAKKFELLILLIFISCLGPSFVSPIYANFQTKVILTENILSTAEKFPVNSPCSIKVDVSGNGEGSNNSVDVKCIKEKSIVQDNSYNLNTRIVSVSQ